MLTTTSSAPNFAFVGRKASFNAANALRRTMIAISSSSASRLTCQALGLLERLWVWADPVTGLFFTSDSATINAGVRFHQGPLLAEHRRRPSAL
jgi:hypothetical protein